MRSRAAILLALVGLVLLGACRDLVLPGDPAPRLRGQLLDHRGDPVTNYLAELRLPGGEELQWSGFGDEEGRFEAPLPAGHRYDLRFSFEASPHLDFGLAGQLVPAGGIVLALPSPNFRARVVVPAGFPAFPAPLVGRVYEGPIDNRDHAEIATDHDGWFELHVPWEELYLRAFSWGGYPRFQYRWRDRIRRDADPAPELLLPLRPMRVALRSRGEPLLGSVADLHWYGGRRAVSYHARKPVGEDGAELWVEDPDSAVLLVSTHREDMPSFDFYLSPPDSVVLELAELSFRIAVVDGAGRPEPRVRVDLNNYYDQGNPGRQLLDEAGEVAFWTRPMRHHMVFWHQGEAVWHVDPTLVEDASIVVQLHEGEVTVLEGAEIFGGAMVACGAGTRPAPPPDRPRGP